MPLGIFLFSIDLEDVRFLVPNGMTYRESLPDMTGRYLEFLNSHNSRATFFVMGKVAQQYPDLVMEIQDRGHEVACHSHAHIPLDMLGKDRFREDLEDNLEALSRAGINQPRGYRAPTFSLTGETQWAYSILRDYGIQYSSSVLPASNPLYGWPDFGDAPRMITGVTEIPVTVSGFSLLRVPFAGGIYLRAIPSFLIRLMCRQRLSRNLPLVSYLHPYDIDDNQERFMHPGISGNHLYNWLMYANRKTVFAKLDAILDLGYCIRPYYEYLKILSEVTDSESRTV